MKKILLFCFLFLSFLSFAQLDREHWFAPMYDGQSNPSNEEYLHISTNDPIPFNVQVFSNNVVIAQRNISKGNPAIISIPRNYIITTNTSDVLRVINKGIYVKAEKPCFANFRFGVSNHAEIITSKGTAGIGTQFYTVVAPNIQNSTNLGFAASFLATEDNTTVTVNNFKRNLTFTSGGNLTNITFTLNKGQSYIIDGRSNTANNFNGFIGATVTSDKPISMSNGNFNGQYATTNNSSGSDILMDQSVPVDKLGAEFVIVKGYGLIGNNMEGAIVVATEDNTAVYVNDATTPIVTLANKGDYFVINENNYTNRGNGHYNLHIISDKNIYVYQLLGGVETGSSPLATGGMNYIPPLNCYLPKKIDELSYISRIADTDPDTRFTTKLNVITEKGAVIRVNGAIPNANFGPYDISNIAANQKWVSYSIPNVTGNITVESTKAVTAGIASGNGAFGYGGYFAGFSAIPLIIKTGRDCLNQGNVFLELTQGFDNYQWYERDLAGNEILIPGATTYIYQVTRAGIYFAKVKEGSCAPVTTKDYKFYNCNSYTNYDYNSCGTEVITPKFALSSQAVNPATVKLITPPTKGVVTIAADGKVTYTANPNVSGTDTFKYSFCGISPIPDCEEAQITVEMIEWKNDVLQECSTNGIASYNLTLSNVTSDTTLGKSYFTTENGARNNIAAERITAFTNYSSVDTFVYVRLEKRIGSITCVAVARVELKSKLAPEVKENLYTKLHCDEDVDGKIDGVYKVNLTTITPIVLVQASNFVVKYYEDVTKATAGLNDNITGTFSFTSDRSIWIRVDAPNGCSTVIKEIQLKTGTKFTVNDPVTVFECDNDMNNSESILLSDYTSLFTTDATATVQFYNTLQSAQDNTPAIASAQTVTAPRTFYYRFKRPGFCDTIGTLNISVKAPTPTALLDTYTVCEGTSITLTAESAPTYTNWAWKLGAATVSTTNTATLSAGVYTVSFTDSSGCIFTKNITVVDSPKPQLNVATYNATLCDDNFDGIINVNFSTITPIIVPNFAANPGLFTVKYYTSPGDANAGGPNNLPNNYTFTTDTDIYVRVESQYCTYVTAIINFKFGTNLPLIKVSDLITICDNDLNGTENINLASYRNLFTADTAATVRYFATLQDAQNNTANIVAAQAITADKTFYYRFTKTGFCPVIGTLSVSFKAATPTALLNSYTVCQGESVTLNAESSYTSWLWKKGTATVSTTSTATLNAGVYTIAFTNTSGCVFTKTITVVDSPKPQLNVAAYNATLCDDNFDGIINVNLSTITPIIVPNFAANPGLFNVRYYTSQPFADAGGANNLPNNFTFTTDTDIYVRVESQYCTYITAIINFKFGTNLPLIKPSDLITICDNDLNGTENINLASYRNLFTADTAATVRYFATLQDAQNNTANIVAAQAITADKTFYYRFTKTGFCPVIGTLNVSFKAATPTALLNSYTVCQGESVTLNAESSYTSWLWKKGTATVSTTQSATLNAGVYTISFTNTSGCIFTKTITVVDSPRPLLNTAAYNSTLCDSNFDGNSDPVNFNAITPIIVPNFVANPGLFNVRYYLVERDRDLGTNNTILNLTNWTFSVNTTVYVRVESQYCTFIPGVINFKFGNNIPILTPSITTKECDDDFDGIKTSNLANYISQFTTEPGVAATYFANLPDAQNNNNAISSNVTINQSGTYYIRLRKNNFCDVVVKLVINIQIPVKSNILVDKNICPEATTKLDAGPGFDKYLWSTGETSSEITVPVGDYWVELTTNGCTYKQFVSVKAVSLPTIVNVEIKGSTVTVNVTGGNPPYQYAIDNGNYQSSNIFTNVRGGDHTIYVISSDNCDPVSTEINVIEIFNAITPNNDGINDILNYSALLNKEDPFMQIFDRYGKIVFTGDKNNRYSWDGKAFGKGVATGSYWYVMKWKEPGFNTITEYSGWVLVKNRE